MPLTLSYCPFRLRFTHPFGTSHGLRDGTDAVFIRAEQDGFTGYGEVTLPPYLKEQIPQVIERLKNLTVPDSCTAGEFLGQLDAYVDVYGHPGLRAGLHCALVDLLSRMAGQSAREFLGITADRVPQTLVTLGISPVADVARKLAELPMSGALKVKVGDREARRRLASITALDHRLLFIDGNQGALSVDDALGWMQAVGRERVLGVEQPFSTDRDEWNQELAERAGVVVYADESIQDPEDLLARARYFGGVNLKLMKCGGLDRALAMAQEAEQSGLKVMLGSMSESSLGCTAMAQLAGRAELVDLDGPWLLANDPFVGLGMQHGRLAMPRGPGFGAALRAPVTFTPIGA